MEITVTHKYGVRINGDLAAWGTNDKRLANQKAKAWGGRVENLEALGRDLEKLGAKIIWKIEKNR